MKSFSSCCYYKFVTFILYSLFYNGLFKLMQIFLVILLCGCKRYGFCLISFLSLYDLFPAFTYAINTGNLVNSLFGVSNLIPCLSFTSSSSPSSGGMGDNQQFFLNHLLTLYHLILLR